MTLAVPEHCSENLQSLLQMGKLRPGRLCLAGGRPSQCQEGCDVFSGERTGWGAALKLGLCISLGSGGGKGVRGQVSTP